MDQRTMWSMGTVEKQEMLCDHTRMIHSAGVWFNDVPVYFVLPVSLFLIITIFVTTRVAYFCLRPLSQSLFIAQMSAGVLLGQTLFKDPQHGVISGVVYPPQVEHIARTLGELGLTLHMFMLGLQLNPQMLMNTNRKAVSIGVSSVLFPFFFTNPATKLSKEPKDPGTFELLLSMTLALQSISAFVVITNLLNHLKILNSELGRLASSASLVSEAFAWFVYFILYNILTIQSHSVLKLAAILFSTCLYYLMVFFLVRPAVLWITRRSRDGKTLSENQLVMILTLVLSVSFIGEYIGQTSGFTAFMLGVSLPDGPPLGSQWEKRIDVIVSGIFLPLYFVVGAGVKIDMGEIVHNWSIRKEIVLLMSYLIKFVGTFLPTLFFKMPLREAIVVCLIMSCKGIVEINGFVRWMDQGIIGKPLFSAAVMNMLVITGLLTFLISRLYDPSARYKAFNRRSLVESQTSASSTLRVLVCIHNEDNVSPTIHFLEATNPSRTNPLTVLVLQLNELTGRAVAIFTPHQHSNSSLTRSKHLLNAFDQLQRRTGRGNIAVEHFTAVSPYASMHDDICTLALDKNVNIVIVPFHKIWGIDGEAEEFCPNVRAVNQSVLQKSPCSVGILIDRSLVRSSRAKKPIGTINSSAYNVTMLFIGSDDDFEALALAKRMAKHPNVYLTVVHLRSKYDELIDCNLDDLVGFENYSCETRKRVVYQEEVVEDGEETIQNLRRIEETSDLVIVGKQQQVNSAVLSGLNAWGECPELGLLGDLMATPDFSFSVLVVQKEPLVYRK